MNLKNDLVTLRAPEPNDLDFLFLLENDPVIAAESVATAPVSRQQMWDYIQSYESDVFKNESLRLVIVENQTGGAVGCVDLSDFSLRNRHANIGIAIDEDFRNKGFGSAAVSLLCSYASEVLGCHSLAAVISADNKASCRMFEKCGFRGCGRLRSWIRRGMKYTDAQIMQILFT